MIHHPSWSPFATATFRTPRTGSGVLSAVGFSKGELAPTEGITLQWASNNPNLWYFEIEVSPDSQFRTGADATASVWCNLVHGGVTNPPNSWTTPPLEPGKPYYWRVRPRVQGDGTPVGWSPTFCFGSGCQSAPPVTLPPAPAYGVPPSGDLYTVAEVVDGDTLKVWLAGKVEVVGVIGIDAPALGTATTPGGCYGREAATRASELLEGTRVYLATDPAQGTRDAAGRLMAYVWLQDIRNFGETMLRGGYARESGHGKPYSYQPPYQAAQQEAMANGRGLWAANTCGGR